MKLEFLQDISDRGIYSEVMAEQLVRLYDFDNFQASEFCKAIQQTIIKDKKSLDLKEMEYIKPLNCNLTLRLSKSNIGITTLDKKDFYCDLAIRSYEDMIFLLEPFCNQGTNGYQWLYDLDNETEFLFSTDGLW